MLIGHVSFDVVIQEEFNMVVYKWQYVYHVIQIYTVNNSQSDTRTEGPSSDKLKNNWLV